MPVCEVTDEEFILLINAICIKEMGQHQSYFNVTSVDDKLLDTNIDSLSVMMLFVWLSEGFGMTDEESETALTGDVDEEGKPIPITVQRIIDFVKKYQTQGYTFEEVRKIFKDADFEVAEENA